VAELQAESGYCPFCGAGLPTGAAFCPRCGRSVGTAGHARPPWFAGAVIAAVVALVAVGVAIAVNTSDDDGSLRDSSTLPNSVEPAPFDPRPTGANESDDSDDSDEPGDAREFAISLRGRSVMMPIDVSFDAESMPAEDVGQVIEEFERHGSLVVQEITSPVDGTDVRRLEIALEVGDFILELGSPRAGTIQIVTNFAMWPHTSNGDGSMAEFPTQIFELDAASDTELRYLIDPHALGSAFNLESIDNLFVSTSSTMASLRIVRHGYITVDINEQSGSVSGRIDLVGWARTGAPVVPTPEELAPYRYLATFTGSLA